ncbi:MAG: ABC transporter permease [Rhodobacteraceae bacterium]|nr:ABC transporter permease [Paracoccaceae bacterium]
MFRATRPKTNGRSALSILELIFHAAVRAVRKGHRNALGGLLMNILQTVILILVFWVMGHYLGMMRNSIHGGNFVLYIMSGIFLFMTHTKAIGAVAKAEGPTSAMMLHAPMNTIVSIASAALSELYLQTLSAAVVLYVYHAAFTPITIDDPAGAMGMFLLAWASGVGIGMIFKAAIPWAPDFFGVFQTVYSRANMIASGKMFVANALPPHIRDFFDWNPLFHAIDQSRGYVFLNYTPRYTSIEYPVWICAVCLLIGLMGEFYTRKHASASWGAAR